MDEKNDAALGQAAAACLLDQDSVATIDTNPLYLVLVIDLGRATALLVLIVILFFGAPSNDHLKKPLTPRADD